MFVLFGHYYSSFYHILGWDMVVYCYKLFIKQHFLIALDHIGIVQGPFCDKTWGVLVSFAKKKLQDSAVPAISPKIHGVFITTTGHFLAVFST